MLEEVQFDADSTIIRAIVRSTSTGARLTGLAHNTAGLIISTIADKEAAAVAYAQADSEIETVTTLGTYAAPTADKCRFREVDATNHPGLYEFHFANARFAVAACTKLFIAVSGASAEMDGYVLLNGWSRSDTALTAANIADAVAEQTDIAPALANMDVPVSTVGSIDAEGLRAALGMGSPNMDTQLAAIFADTGTDLPALINAVGVIAAAVKAKTDNLPASPAAVGSQMTIGTLTEPGTYPTAGDTTLTLEQLLFATLQRLTEFSISGTNIVVKKRDQTTPAMTLTTNSATAPSSSTQA